MPQGISWQRCSLTILPLALVQEKCVTRIERVNFKSKMEKLITLNELSLLFDKVIKHLREDGLLEIDVDKDYYRFIPTNEWDKHNDTIFTGSLFDDLDGLKSRLNDENNFFTYVDFDRLASILRYISEKQNPVNG